MSDIVQKCSAVLAALPLEAAVPALGRGPRKEEVAKQEASARTPVRPKPTRSAYKALLRAAFKTTKKKGRAKKRKFEAALLGGKCVAAKHDRL
jgi:hypothetical protein